MSGCGHGGPRSHGLGRGRPQQPLARIRELVVLGKLGQRGGGRRMTLLHLANSLARDCKLWTMIADSEPILWSDTLHMLLSCASSAASASRSAVLEEALRALANICTHADKHAMWEDELMMKALLLAGSRRRGGDAHWKVREQAFRALCCLSAEAANQEPMWGHATGITSDVSWEFRRVLLDGVGEQSGGSGAGAGVVEHGLCILANLAVAPANRPSMWVHGQVRLTLLAAAAAGSAHATRALANLAEDASVRRSMGLPPRDAAAAGVAEARSMSGRSPPTRPTRSPSIRKRKARG